MKVYIVYGRVNMESIAEVVRVFANKDSADKFVEQYKTKWDFLLVEEWEIEQ